MYLDAHYRSIQVDSEIYRIVLNNDILTEPIFIFVLEILHFYFVNLLELTEQFVNETAD